MCQSGPKCPKDKKTEQKGRRPRTQEVEAQKTETQEAGKQRAEAPKDRNRNADERAECIGPLEAAGRSKRKARSGRRVRRPELETHWAGEEAERAQRAEQGAQRAKRKRPERTGGTSAEQRGEVRACELGRPKGKRRGLFWSSMSNGENPFRSTFRSATRYGR